MKNRTLTLILTFLFLCIAAKAQDVIDPPDSCLKLVLPNNPTSGEYNNPDSVVVDTCSCSPTHNYYFAKRYYAVRFNDNFYPFETVIQNQQIRTVDDIRDDIPEIKQQFQQIANTLGQIYFIRNVEGYSDAPDSIRLKNTSIWFYFAEPQVIDTVISLISTVDSVKNIFYNSRKTETNYLFVPTDKALVPNITFDNIVPNDISYNFIQKYLKPRGWQTEIYDVNCPLAWEITRGSRYSGLNTVYIAIGDEFPGGSHSELETNLVCPKDMNGLRLAGDGKLDLWDHPGNDGGYGHGLAVTSMCSSGMNNQTQNNSNPMVGTAPECKFVIMRQGYSTINDGNLTYYNIEEINQYDIDGIVDNTHTIANVQNMSFGSLINDWRYPNDIISSGVIVVAGAGNFRDNMSGLPDLQKEGVGYKLINRPEGNDFSPVVFYPAGNVFYDKNEPENPYLDYKLIAVGATRPGILIDENCEDRSNFPLNYFQTRFVNPKFTDDIQFQMNFNFSPDVDKFNNNADPNIRIPAKENAFVDIVAPGWHILTACTGDKFKLNDGTSFATPMVSGIVGLMLSINALPVSTNTLPIENGESNQRKVYSILTFTAKKIIDRNNIDSYTYWDRLDVNKDKKNDNNTFYSSTFPPGHLKEGQEYQWEYVEQQNDNLKRWWAQRVGFGLVNAYRAVAHSIANKGLYSYSSADLLDFTPSGNGNINSEGFHLLHFGAKAHLGKDGIPITRKPGGSIDDEINVLEWGGASIPGDVQAYNNQGVTYFDDLYSRVQLEVPDMSLLAIDGLLLGEQVINNELHKIFTTGNGKILMEGYIKDVQLEGNLKVGDLVVASTIEAGNLLFNSPFYNGEIYGKVELRDKAKILIGTGALPLILQPGGQIILNGTQDLIIGYNQELRIKSSCKILTNNDKKIVIEDGGKLTIDEGAEVTFNCPIDILDGGNVIFETHSKMFGTGIHIYLGGTLTMNNSSAILPLDINNLGKVIIHPGATLTINNPNDAEQIGLIGGIDIQGNENNHGVFECEEDSKVDIGPISADVYSDITINSGCDIRLFAKSIHDGITFTKSCMGYNENIILGTLTIGVSNPNKKTYISGFEGKNPYQCDGFGVDNFVFTNFILFYQYLNAWVFHLPSINIRNTEFNNVTFQMNYCQKEDISNCSFGVDGDIIYERKNSPYSDYFKDLIPGSILDISNFANSLYLDYFPSSVQDLNVIDCTFKDDFDASKEMTWLQQTPEGVNENPNHFTAVSAYRMRNVTVSNPAFSGYSFEGFNSGVHTVACSRVNINNTKFKYCVNGAFDQYSMQKLCSNTFEKTNVGNNLTFSKWWSTYGNTFNMTSKAAQMQGVVQGQNYRGNYFNDYFNGINFENSTAYLRGAETSDPNDNMLHLQGRNEFEIPDITLIDPYPTEPLSNPFCYRGPNNTPNYFNPVERSDIYMTDKDDESQPNGDLTRVELKIQCGKNNMGQFTPNHLYYDKGTTTNQLAKPDLPVHCNTNKWRDGNSYNIKNFQVNEQDVSDIDNSADRIEGCTDGEPETKCNPYSPIILPCGYFVRNEGTWPEADSAVIDAEFSLALNNLCNGILSCDCMKQVIFDAMQLAALATNSEEKLDSLLDCLEDKLQSPLLAACPKPDWLMMMAEARERLGQLDYALADYNYILNNYPNSSDTTFARWRIMFIGAMNADTTFGFVYDSLMAGYYRRVLNDICKIDTSGGGLQKRGSFDFESGKPAMKAAEEPSALEQNSPNPFGSLTVISFRIEQESDVELCVMDLSGNLVQNLVSNRLKKGSYVITFNKPEIASGTYICMLLVDGKRYMKTMQCVK